MVFRGSTPSQEVLGPLGSLRPAFFLFQKANSPFRLLRLFRENQQPKNHSQKKLDLPYNQTFKKTNSYNKKTRKNENSRKKPTKPLAKNEINRKKNYKIPKNKILFFKKSTKLLKNDIYIYAIVFESGSFVK